MTSDRLSVAARPGARRAASIRSGCRAAATALALLAAWPAIALSQAGAPATGQAESTPSQPSSTPRHAPDVVFVPTPPAVVEAMLQLAEVTDKDVVYDLGSGDGRIVIAAAKRGAKAVGYEVRPELLAQGRESIVKENLKDRAEIREGDLFEADLSPASVVTLYLIPSLNLKLMPKLQKELKPGSRIVSHAFDMGTWKPDAVREVEGRTIYLWRIPPTRSQ
jgi:SAM-dependent methyltransferase